MADDPLRPEDAERVRQIRNAGAAWCTEAQLAWVCDLALIKENGASTLISPPTTPHSELPLHRPPSRREQPSEGGISEEERERVETIRRRVMPHEFAAFSASPAEALWLCDLVQRLAPSAPAGLPRTEKE